MALSRTLFLALLLIVFAYHMADARHDWKVGSKIGRSLLATTIDCGAACSQRCRLSSRHNLCMRACGTCCARCNCVPPGTYGNKEQCPCYDSLTTHGGRKKCP